jgi:hypothetical protein
MEATRQQPACQRGTGISTSFPAADTARQGKRAYQRVNEKCASLLKVREAFYQENLPSLKTLSDPDHHYNNYYFWFALLNLMDKIYIELYRKYQQVFEDR